MCLLFAGMSGSKKRSREKQDGDAGRDNNIASVERSVYTSSSSLFFCVWDARNKTMSFAFSPCLGFQNWGAHLCAQGIWGEQQAFRASPASALEKLTLVKRADKQSHFLAFAVSLPRPRPPPAKQESSGDKTPPSKETFFAFCFRVKPLSSEKITSFWMQQVLHTSDGTQRIRVLRDLCHQVLSFSLCSNICFDECITCLWFLRTLSQQEPCLPCSITDCLHYLASALSTRMALLSNHKGRLAEIEGEGDVPALAGGKKSPRISVVLKTLKKPLKSIPVVRDVLDPFIKCLALCQEEKNEDDLSSEEIILPFQTFLVERLRWYLSCHREQRLEMVCAQTKLFLSQQHGASIQADLVLSQSQRKVCARASTNFGHEILAASGHAALAGNPEYLKLALVGLSAPPEAQVSVLRLVPELQSWLGENENKDLRKPSDFLYKHFPTLVTTVLEAQEAKIGEKPPGPVVKKEKTPSLLRHQNFKDQSDLLLSVFGIKLGSPGVEGVPALEKPPCTSSSLLPQVQTRFLLTPRLPATSRWVVERGDLHRFKKLWLCLCLAFHKTPIYQTIFSKPWFYSELLLAYQTEAGQTGALDVLQLAHDLGQDHLFSTLRQKCSQRWGALLRSASTEQSGIRAVLRQSLLLWAKTYASFRRESSARGLHTRHPPGPFLGGGVEHTVKKEEPDELATTASLRVLREASDSDSRAKLWTLHQFILAFSQNQWAILAPGKEPLVLICQAHSLKKKNAFCRPLLGKQGPFSLVFKNKEDFCVEKLHGACCDPSRRAMKSSLPSPSSRRSTSQVVLTPSNAPLLATKCDRELCLDPPSAGLSASKQTRAELVSLSLFLRYRNVCGHFFSLNAHMPARKIYPQSILMEAAKRNWLTFQGSKQLACIARLKELPSLGSLTFDKADAFLVSPSLHFSVVQDLAFLLLFLQHHLPPQNRRWLSPLLSSRGHALWSRPCSEKCSASCFCIDRFAPSPSCSPSERANVFPWFNVFVLVLARHVALFRMPPAEARTPEHSLRLEIADSNAWLFLLKEAQQLLSLAGGRLEGTFPALQQDHSGEGPDQTGLWKRKKLNFEKAWNSYLVVQRFLHLKSHAPGSKFHGYLSNVFEDAKSGRRRKFELQRKHLWFTQEVRKRSDHSTTRTDCIEKTSLSLYMQKVLEEDAGFASFKVGLFLNNLSQEEGPLPLSRSTSRTRPQATSRRASESRSGAQERTLLLKHAPLGRSLEAAPGIHAHEYLQLVQIFQEANAYFMKEGNPDQSRRKSTETHYFHDLLPWPPSVLHCLMYFEQIAALAPRRIGGGQPLISLQVIVPPGSSWHCTMVWVLIAHLLLDAAVTKAVGDPPCIILVNPKQIHLFELVISAFDALVRVPSFADQHAVQWVCDSRSCFLLSSKDSTRGSWEYYQRQAVPLPGKRNVMITDSVSDLHPALLGKGLGRVLNLLSLASPDSPPPALPPCLVVLNTASATATATARKKTASVTLALQNTPLSVEIELLPEFTRGGFLRPSEPGRISRSALPAVLEILLRELQHHEESRTSPSSSPPKTKLGEFLGLKRETKRKSKQSSQTRETRVQAAQEDKGPPWTQARSNKATARSAPGSDLQPTLPPLSLPTLGSFMGFLEKNLRQPTSIPKKHYELFRGHLWPKQVRPHVSRENLSTCFYLLRKLLEPDRSGECEIPPVAPIRMISKLSKLELLFHKSHRESEMCCRKAASDLAALVPEAQIRRTSVLPGMHVYAILKTQVVATVRKALQETFSEPGNAWVMTPREAFGSAEQPNEDHKPLLVLGTWPEFTQATATDNRAFWVPLQRPSHVFFDEAYGNKLKTHFSWMFTNHVHTDIPEDLLSLWSVR